MSVRRIAKRMAAWERYTRRYLVRDEVGFVIKMTRTTDTDIMWYDRWLTARRAVARNRRNKV